MKKYFPIVVRVLLALPMIVFGLNKFLFFAEVAPPADPVAQTFMGAMFGSYLGKLVGLFEIIGGVMLLFQRTAFLGLLVLLPIIFNIILFHFAHDFIGNGLWLFPTILFLIAAFLYKNQFQTLLKIS